MRPAMGADYSFTRRPRWVVGHVIALAAIVLFVSLGMWQLRRLEARSALDRRLEERITSAPIDLETAKAMDIEDLEYRRVQALGTFDAAGEVILQARSFGGRSGHNVLSPLVYDGSAAVVVNRGWVPIDVEGPPVVGAEPAPGRITVEGIARKSEQRRGLGPIDPATGVLQRISRVDIERLEQQSAYLLEPFYLQLVAPDPAQGFPLVLDVPQPGGGPPHLSYAVQWFAFSGVVAVGYPLLLRSTARKERGEATPLSPGFPSKPSSEPSAR